MKKIFNYLFIIFISLSLLISSGCRRSSEQGGNGRVPVPSSMVNESTPNPSENDKEESTKETPSTDNNSQSSNKKDTSKDSGAQSTPNATTENNKNNNGQTSPGAGSSGTGNNTSGDNSTTNNNSTNNSTENSGSLPSLPNNYGYEFSSEVEDKILSLINAERSTAGVVSLSANSTLRSAARYKANEMLQYDYFSHSSPYTNQPSDIAKAYGHSFNTFGENLFSISSSTRSSLRESISAERIVAEWMASEGHKSNILNVNYRKTGIGVVIGSNGKCYISQMFSD